MTLLLGLFLGGGVLLTASPWLWPKGSDKAAATERPSTLRDRIVQAGLLNTPVLAVAAVATVCGLFSAGVALVLLPVSVLGVAAFVAGSALPLTVIAWRARRRRRARAEVWPDVVDHLVSGVRSGLALPDAVAALQTTGPTHLRTDFTAYAADYGSSGSFDYAAGRLKARLADPVADRILETLRMAREVGGGELTRVLRELGAYLRDDLVVRSELEARQSWVVNAARLGVVAPWIVLVLLASRPEAAVAYNSAGGMTVIVIGIVITVVAYRVMVHMGRLPEEGRWFA